MAGWRLLISLAGWRLLISLAGWRLLISLAGWRLLISLAGWRLLISLADWCWLVLTTPVAKLVGKKPRPPGYNVVVCLTQEKTANFDTHPTPLF